MAEKRRGLGRNLGMLLSSVKPTEKEMQPVSISSRDVPVSSENTENADNSNNNSLRFLPIENLQRGKYQPRRDMHPESLQELADSIRSQGILQPIVVRPVGAVEKKQGKNKQYEIVAGERRWRAAQLAGLSEVPALIRDVPDEAAVAIALIENIQRENLNPMEEAIALDRLCKEFELTHQQAADAVGKSRATISNLLRLMQLQPDVKHMLEDGRLDMGHARALLALDGPIQIQLANIIIDKGLSVREAEKLVQKQQAPKTTAPTSTQVISPDIQRLEQRISDTLGATVHLQHSNKGKGQLTIHYNSTDELDGILAHFMASETDIA
jgi:ParB family transcriptional regulator, chromosome partitioning protein